MATSASAPPPPGAFFGTLGQTLPLFDTDSAAQNLPLAGSLGSVVTVAGLQSLDQDNVVVAEDFVFTGVDGSVTATTDPSVSPGAPFVGISNLTVSGQSKVKFVDVESGLDLAIIDALHPIRFSKVVPSNNPPVSPGAQASNLASYAQGSGSASGNFYLTVPLAAAFDMYVDYVPNPADGGQTFVQDSDPHAAIVSPQFMSGTRRISPAFKLAPLVVATPGDGLWYGGAAVTAASWTASLSLFRRGYVQTNQAFLPPPYIWQRSIFSEVIPIGATDTATFTVPQVGQIGAIVFRVRDPGTIGNVIEPPVTSLSLTQAGQTRFNDIAFTNFVRLQEQLKQAGTGGNAPPFGNFFGWDLWTDDTGRRTNTPGGINTIVTAAPKVEVNFTSGALSSSAQLIVTYDSLQLVLPTGAGAA